MGGAKEEQGTIKSKKSRGALKKTLKKTDIRNKMLFRLNSARLRYLNDEMYNGDSKKVLKEKTAFRAYHDSFKEQQQAWSLNPLDKIIQDIKRIYDSSDQKKGFVMADFGCGDAKIAQEFEGTDAKVHSIDFVALNKYVTAGDMANTNIPEASVDIAVYCLSLMSSNCNEYIKEARRVLKKGGRLFIAEVTSRIEDVKKLVAALKDWGFTLQEQHFLSDDYFCYFKLTKIGKFKRKPADIEFSPCKYKKR